MYKDREKQKESDRERARLYRMRKRGVTPSHPDQNVTPAVTPRNHTLPKVITSPDEVPPPPKIYREDLMSKESAKKLKALPQGVQSGIKDVLVARKRLHLFDDSEERIDRAIKYQEWL